MNANTILKVKVKDGVSLIDFNTVVYIKSSGKQSVILTSENRQVVVYHTLQWLEKNLPAPVFCRCHHSYIINCTFFESLNLTKCQANLNGFGSIPVSRSNKEKILFSKKSLLLKNLL